MGAHRWVTVCGAAVRAQMAADAKVVRSLVAGEEFTARTNQRGAAGRMWARHECGWVCQVGEAGTVVIERLRSPPNTWIVCAKTAVQEDVGPKAAVVGELQEGEVREPI